jgi:hypothetical protein
MALIAPKSGTFPSPVASLAQVTLTAGDHKR